MVHRISSLARLASMPAQIDASTSFRARTAITRTILAAALRSINPARGAALDSARAEKHDAIPSICSRCALEIARCGIEPEGAPRLMASERAATDYSIRNRAAWIRMNRPEARNALTEPLLGELADRLDAAIGEPRARAVVLTGSGSAFCAGADLKRGGAGVTSLARGAGIASAAAATSSADANAFVAVLERMQRSPKPVICAVNGHAFGGGIGLVAAADIAIAVRDATFAFSEVRLGVIPAIISVVVLPKLGPHHALRLFLTGGRFTAVEAVDYGLVHRVVEPDALESAVQAEVDAIAQGAPQALAEAKRLVREIPRCSADEAYVYAAQVSAKKFASEEAAEGLAAFAQKRPPSWAVADRDD